MPDVDVRGYTMMYPGRGRSDSNSDTCSEAPMERHDIQTAVRRNLRNWAQWRTEINGSLVDSMITGQCVDTVAPLRTYLKSSVPHATDNPKTLLAYSAALDNISKLQRSTFLSYGIPRVKVPPARVPSMVERVPSVVERVPSVVEPRPDYPEDNGRYAADDDDVDDGDYEVYDGYDDVVPSHHRHHAMSGRTGSSDRYERHLAASNSHNRRSSASSNGLTPNQTRRW